MVFFFMAAQSGGHDTGPSQVTDDLPRILTTHNRQAPDVVAHHSRDCFMKNLIREGDKQKRKTLLVAGAAGGMSAIFNAPGRSKARHLVVLDPELVPLRRLVSV